MTDGWTPPPDARPRHYAWAMLGQDEAERARILTLAPPEWRELIETHYALFLLAIERRSTRQRSRGG